MYFKYSSALNETVPVTPCGEISSVTGNLQIVKCLGNPSPRGRVIIVRKLGSQTLSYPCEIEVYGTQGKCN